MARLITVWTVRAILIAGSLMSLSITHQCWHVLSCPDWEIRIYVIAGMAISAAVITTTALSFLAWPTRAR